ncbi:MAG TPA: cupin domain-containing protein [Ramlibacter sp.]|jgi:50S ribosomal protein L16 3-hydroxylase|nr:cupin domain-containing protein [Ramlibacter sp.]
MNATRPTPLLGGLTPAQFMRKHWQKKPLLVRNAIPGFQPLLTPRELFTLAGQDEVESRLVVHEGANWRLQRGPFARRALPALRQPGWTLLVQGVDLHDARAHALLHGFSFLPAARLDDLMVSYATDQGGVGPHFDSYDVFLLQAQGQRRWRIGRKSDFVLQPDVPLKILANFEAEEEYVLEPGDMLYLPPRYAHDGIAQGECQTYSIGFRAPARAELARELLQRMADAAGEQEEGEPRLYRDADQPATEAPGAIPEGLAQFARDALASALKDPDALQRALGEYLSEPKANVWFEPAAAPRRLRTLVLDARTRMLHDGRHVFINGEAWRAAGKDAMLMRRLADRRRLEERELAGASAAARELLQSWCEAGWAHANGGHDG